MMTRLPVALIALGTLFLTGCSSIEEAAPPASIEETVTSPEPTSAAEETTAAPTEALPSPEATPEPQPAPVPAPPAPAPTPVPEAAAPVASAPANSPADTSKFGPAVKNGRGNVVKSIGQLAGYDQTASGNMTVEFRVTGIRPNYQCTSGYSYPSLNGNYIAVSFEVETLPSLAEAPTPAFYLSEYDMAILSPSGVLENDSIGNALWCLQDSEELPWGIGPGQKAYGTIVLDSAYTSGSLIIALPGGARWEWTF